MRSLKRARPLLTNVAYFVLFAIILFSFVVSTVYICDILTFFTELSGYNRSRARTDAPASFRWTREMIFSSTSDVEAILIQLH